MSQSDYIQKNRTSWNQRTAYHIQSDFYDLKGFIQGKSSLNEIETRLLGDIRGKSLLHLQCHFGQDTLSLARLGAVPTGVDLSDRAIEEAQKLNEQLGLKARFICCDLYELPENLDERFDIVFTTYGTIGWLPDLDRWAKIVRRFLKPGGTFLMAEFHPVVWMFDDDFAEVKYRYFKSDPIVEITNGTYADRDAPIQLESVSWNHGLSEVVGSLLANGLQIIDFQEYDYSPYDCFNHTEKLAENKYRIKHLGNKIPMVYSLKAIAPN